MGTFAWLFSDGGKVPENKREEFTKRIEKLCQAGGMMEVEYIQLYGKRLAMIRKATMHEEGMNFYYNYFEDNSWENAGFNREKCSVWSGKIGWMHFHKAIVAAYVLEELYTEGVASAIVDGDPVTSWGYIGWINYLFDLRKHIKNYDAWKLFEAFHDSEDEEYISRMDWADFGEQRYAFISGCEIQAVLNGTENALEVYKTKAKEEVETLAINCMNDLVKVLKLYKQESKLDEENQMEILLDMVSVYYEKDAKFKDYENLEDNLKKIFIEFEISDAPAFMIKAISEIYEKDFWELWKEIGDVARRKLTKVYGNDSYYIVPISTQEFFRQSPDDMIPYWEKDCDIEFSKGLREWFDALKKRYEEIFEMELLIENPLKYILTLMEEAEENYYRIYTFSEFFEETLENLKDKRYLVLWKLYEEMLHDPELKKAGDVIFVPEGPEYEHKGLHYLGKTPKRRLWRNWDNTSLDKRNNIARVTFRRYMALVANRELRVQVFGF